MSPTETIIVDPDSAIPVSCGVLVLAGVTPVKVGAAGAAVSTTKVTLELSALVLPALSAAVAVIACVPSVTVAVGV